MKAVRCSAWMVVVGGMVVAGSGRATFAQQERTERFVIELVTQTMAMPFKMPAMEGMPNIPGLTDMFAPKRRVAGEATYPNKAVEPVFVTAPTDLGLPQNKLPLRVAKPAQGEGREGAGGTGTGKVQLTVKLFWGCGRARGPIENSINFDTSKVRMSGGKKGMPGADWGQSREWNDKTATGSEEKLPAKVVGKGQYVLNTNGTAVLDGFLPPIKVTQPESLAEANIAEQLEVAWEPVNGARGYILHAMGMTMQGQQIKGLVNWVSTASEPPERVRNDYEQATTIADDLKNGILLSSDTTSCTIPAGIFRGIDTFVLTVTAVGNDYFDRTVGLTVVGKIRSKWTCVKSKEMEGMQGMPGMGGGEDN